MLKDGKIIKSQMNIQLTMLVGLVNKIKHRKLVKKIKQTGKKEGAKVYGVTEDENEPQISSNYPPIKKM